MIPDDAPEVGKFLVRRLPTGDPPEPRTFTVTVLAETLTDDMGRVRILHAYLEDGGKTIALWGFNYPEDGDD